MKENKLKDIRRLIIDNRLFSVLFFSVILLSLIAVIDNLMTIRPQDSLQWVRQNGFAVEKLYREQWYYYYLFMLFNLVVSGFNLVFSIKFFKSRHLNLAIVILIVTIVLLVMSIIFFNSLIVL